MLLSFPVHRQYGFMDVPSQDGSSRLTPDLLHIELRPLPRRLRGLETKEQTNWEVQTEVMRRFVWTEFLLNCQPSLSSFRHGQVVSGSSKVGEASPEAVG